MYNVKWLATIARDGLNDLVPAMRQAFNADPTDDRLGLVYGASPRRNIVAIAVAGIVAGHLFSLVEPALSLGSMINWSAVFVGAAHASLIRRYLFQTEHAQAQDYPWLAASMAPAVVLLMLIAALKQLADAQAPADLVGSVLVALTVALGTAAAFVIAVAALCFSRNWLRALWDLAVRLLVFRIMVFITTLILLEIGIVGPIVSAIVGNIFDLHLPDWIPEILDQLGYAAVLGIVYLAVVGATWTVCRERFATLIETGQVNILDSVALMAKDPAQLEKKRRKKLAREEKKRAKRNRNKPDT